MDLQMQQMFISEKYKSDSVSQRTFTGSESWEEGSGVKKNWWNMNLTSFKLTLLLYSCRFSQCGQDLVHNREIVRRLISLECGWCWSVTQTSAITQMTELKLWLDGWHAPALRAWTILQMSAGRGNHRKASLSKINPSCWNLDLIGLLVH